VQFFIRGELECVNVYDSCEWGVNEENTQRKSGQLDWIRFDEVLGDNDRGLPCDSSYVGVSSWYRYQFDAFTDLINNREVFFQTRLSIGIQSLRERDINTP
jgi:hypothetical protein